MIIRNFVKKHSSNDSLVGKIFTLADQKWEILTYVFFGAMTTLVDWTVRFFLYKTKLNYHISDVIAWVLAVLFAFFTNRIFVFESKRNGFLPVAAELAGFAGGRVISLAIQELLMHVAVSIIGMNKTLVMIPVSVIVVIINYFLGKVIFASKK